MTMGMSNLEIDRDIQELDELVLAVDATENYDKAVKILEICSEIERGNLSGDKDNKYDANNKG